MTLNRLTVTSGDSFKGVACRDILAVLQTLSIIKIMPAKMSQLSRDKSYFRLLLHCKLHIRLSI